MIKNWTKGVCLIGAAAISLSAAATAQALPEWQKEGKALTTALPFKLKGGSGSFENAAATTKVSWTSVGGSGLIEGASLISNLSLIFWGSTAKEGAGKSCEVNSPKAAKLGEVVTRPLKGVLGYLNKAGKQVGDLFEPVTGEVFAEIEGECLKGKKLLVTGSVIGKITSALNTEVGAVQLSFNVVSKAQEFVEFEKEGKEHKLAFGEPGEAALFECHEETAELELGEKVELKA